MKNSILGIVVLSMTLMGCTEKTAPTAKSAAGDAGAGKIVAERNCKACHGANGGGVAP